MASALKLMDNNPNLTISEKESATEYGWVIAGLAMIFTSSKSLGYRTALDG